MSYIAEIDKRGIFHSRGVAGCAFGNMRLAVRLVSSARFRLSMATCVSWQRGHIINAQPLQMRCGRALGFAIDMAGGRPPARMRRRRPF